MLPLGFKEALQLYGALGAGGFAVVILGISYYRLVNKLVDHITPALEKVEIAVNQIEIEYSSSKEVVRNNTDAIKEISKSNDNIATALGLLKGSFDSVVKLLEKQDQRTEDIDKNLGKARGDLSLIKQKLNCKEEK